MKKLLSFLVLATAGGALASIASRTPAPSYAAPTAQEVQAHLPAPKTLATDVPEGCVVRNLAVEGMCCTGCTGKLYARLKTMPGLVAAAVDFDAGLAQAIVPAASDPHALEAALTFDKYTAKLRP